MRFSTYLNQRKDVRSSETSFARLPVWVDSSIVRRTNLVLRHYGVDYNVHSTCPPHGIFLAQGRKKICPNYLCSTTRDKPGGNRRRSHPLQNRPAEAGTPTPNRPAEAGTPTPYR